MSRIGKEPVPLPQGVEVTVQEQSVTVKGPKGSLSMVVPEGVNAQVEDSSLVVRRVDDQPQNRARHGLVRALAANMVAGVTDGYRKELEIVGVGYRAAAKGSGLTLQLGFSHPVEIAAPEGISFEVPTPTRVNVVGTDKQQVGQVAADIRKIRKPEPYKGKGIRYVGEQVRRKAGKSGNK